MVRTVILFRRAALLSAAAALAACSDSNGPITTLTPEEVEVVAGAVNSEVELSLISLQPENASNILALRRASERSGIMFGRRAARPLFAEELTCGTPSQEPPVDSDDDTVPDDLTITFSLPACHFASESGTIDFTGAVRLQDPTPQVGGLAFDVTLDDLTFAFEVQQGGAGSMTREGTQQVRVAGSGLSQTHDFSLTTEFTGEPGMSLNNVWSASFVPVQGQSVVFGLPLPDGTYTIDGSFSWSHGDRNGQFLVDTYTPLEYDAECHQSAASPFQSGEVHVYLASSDGGAYVRIRYSNCGVPDVVYIGGSA
jgi:hypothetical protein